MKAKAGMFTTEISGSVGGHTIQNSNGGLQFRTKPIIKGIPSNSQARIRSVIPILQQGWRMLSDAQRTAWNLFAQDQLSGHSAYISAAFDYYKITGGIIEWPSQIGPPWIGPELVINNEFNSAVGWILTGNATISEGQAHFPGITTATVRQSITLEVGASYLLGIFVTSMESELNLRLTNSYNMQIFTNNWSAYRNYPLGLTSGIAECVSNSMPMRWNGGNSKPGFSLGYVSIKRYYPE